MRYTNLRFTYLHWCENVSRHWPYCSF